MDLAKLRVFVRASELGSFTRAAVSLGLAQPTVSRIIDELETEWRVPLFYRTGRGITLSEFGEEALSRATFLLQEADRINEDLRAISRQPRGAVSIALPPSLMEPVVPALMNQLRDELPGVKLQIYEGFSGQTERWLAEGTIDIGIYSRYWEGEPDKGPALVDSRLTLLGLAEDWNPPPEIDFKELADFPLVLPARTHALREIVDSIARRMKITLNITADAYSTVVHKQMIILCGCKMVKASHVIREERHDRRFASSVIRNPYITRRMVLMTGHQRPLSRAARQVAERATKILHALSGD